MLDGRSELVLDDQSVHSLYSSRIVQFADQYAFGERRDVLDCSHQPDFVKDLNTDYCCVHLRDSNNILDSDYCDGAEYAPCTEVEDQHRQVAE